MSIIGVIGDCHIPGERLGYLQFCADTLLGKYDCDIIVHIGDLVDWHSISFHAKQPMLPAMSGEYTLALPRVQQWQEVFPTVKWCIGNHDELPARQVNDNGMAEFILKPYNELWGLKDWEIDFSFILDDCVYRHGTGTSGIHPAWNLMNKSKMSVVMGHCHSRAGTKWSMNPLKRFFCMDVGCGIDEKLYQFAYGKNLPERPVLACGVVDDGQPISIAMPCGRGEKYHDSNFESPYEKPLIFINKFVKSTVKRTEEKPPIPAPTKITGGGPLLADLLNQNKTKKDDPVHLENLDGRGDTPPHCGTMGCIEITRHWQDVTCGNCKRTKIYKEMKG